MNDRPGRMAANVERVQRRIEEAAARSGRTPDAVQLVAVMKSRPVEAVLEIWRLGLRTFGENRIEEAAPKIARVQAELGEAIRPTWHMIGHVQSRKAAAVIDAVDWVESVDSLRLAERLSRFAVAARKELPILLELNVSGEAAKSGFPLAGWPEAAGQWDLFFQQAAQIGAMPALRVQGLMTVAPIGGAETARPVFRRLAEIRVALRDRLPELDWRHLSMGMSGDFEAAIEEGATMIRLGRILFEFE